MDKLKLVEQTQVRDDLPRFTPGDTINVHYRVREGDKERIQQYEGVVISIRGSGANRTFVVRKVSNAIGVERIFPFASPFIAKIEIKKRGRVRRAKLFYLRERRGKSARLREEANPRGAEIQEVITKKEEVVEKPKESPEQSVAPEAPAETPAPPKEETVAQEPVAEEIVAEEAVVKEEPVVEEEATTKEEPPAEEESATEEPEEKENPEEKG